MVYIKKRTIVICVIIAVIIIGLLVVGLFPKTTLIPTPQEPTISNENQDIDMVRVATKSWANGKWLGNVDKELITSITFTNAAFENVQGNKAWEYDGMKFVLNETEITIYVPYGMKMKGSLHGAFQDMTNLEAITGFAYFDTSETSEMSSMFANCSNLVAVDGPNLKTDNVLTTNKMFYNCTSLEHIDLTKCDMSRVVDMSEMFNNCIKAINIGLPKTEDVVTLKRAFCSVGRQAENYTNLIGKLNTPNCTDMSFMFAGAMIGEYTMAESFDTTSLQTAESMFESCGLPKIDLSNWKTENLTNTKRMFYDNMWCTTIDVSGWSAKKLENTSNMFYYCSRLKELNINWTDTTTLTDASAMFKYCFGLSELNLTGFNDVKIGNTREMFAGCSELTNIYCTGITSDLSDLMFQHCSSLNGKIPYDESQLMNNMANTDGYFTLPNVTIH